MTNRVFETCISITDNRRFVLIFFLNTFKGMIKRDYDIRINMSIICDFVDIYNICISHLQQLDSRKVAQNPVFTQCH